MLFQVCCRLFLVILSIGIPIFSHFSALSLSFFYLFHIYFLDQSIIQPKDINKPSFIFSSIFWLWVKNTFFMHSKLPQISRYMSFT